MEEKGTELVSVTALRGSASFQRPEGKAPQAGFWGLRLLLCSVALMCGEALNE